jgi:hypothetical protein
VRRPPIPITSLPRSVHATPSISIQALRFKHFDSISYGSLRPAKLDQEMAVGPAGAVFQGEASNHPTLLRSNTKSR